MAKVRVLRVFWDLKARRKRNPGEVFEATEERAMEIESLIPQHVSVEYAKTTEQKASEPVEPTQDLSGLTNHQLVALCRERGIEVPKKYKKADLLRLLEG